MSAGALGEPADLQALPAFFFWSSWSAAADRPGKTGLSYTSNWPPEPAVGNTPTAGCRRLVDRQRDPDDRRDRRHAVLPLEAQGRRRSAAGQGRSAVRPEADAVDAGHQEVLLRRHRPDAGPGRASASSPPTMRSRGKASSASRSAEILPYTVSRTIHTQFAVLWIATAWLATGLYIAPAISGHEPKYQKLGRRPAVLCAAVHRGRLDRVRLARHPAARRHRFQLLVRQPGPGIHHHGPFLAVAAVRRPAVLGHIARPRPVAGTEKAERRAAA